MSQTWQQGWSTVLEDFEVEFKYLASGLGSNFQDLTHHSHPPLGLVGMPKILAFIMLTSLALTPSPGAVGPLARTGTNAFSSGMSRGN